MDGVQHERDMDGRSDDGRDPAGRDTDGWFVAGVGAWLKGFLDTDRLVAIAWRIGAATADLHTALSGSRRSTIGARTYFVEATAALQEALAVTDGPVGARLREREPALRAALEPLRTGRLLAAHHVHGDLTVARFHTVETELLVDAPLAGDEWSPALPQSPMFDLATLLQSVDHACRVAVHRVTSNRTRRDAVERVTRLEALLSDSLLEAYTVVHAVDADVLTALRVLVELRHLVRTAAVMPEWAWLPDEALPGLLARTAR
ncbi:MAG: hypothetical protein ACOYMR_13095 [Ilumatobacteraceae bacterium]